MGEIIPVRQACCRTRCLLVSTASKRARLRLHASQDNDLHSYVYVINVRRMSGSLNRLVMSSAQKIRKPSFHSSLLRGSKLALGDGSPAGFTPSSSPKYTVVSGLAPLCCAAGCLGTRSGFEPWRQNRAQQQLSGVVEQKRRRQHAHGGIALEHSLGGCGGG